MSHHQQDDVIWLLFIIVCLDFAFYIIINSIFFCYICFEFNFGSAAFGVAYSGYNSIIAYMRIAIKFFHFDRVNMYLLLDMSIYRTGT